MNSEARLQQLEDVEAIRQLKARYCAACDNDHHPEQLLALFAPDAVWEASGLGRFEGHEQIRGFMTSLRDSGRLRNSAHNVFNPIIEVTGDTATGAWRLLMLYTANADDGLSTQRFRIIGWYRERYVRLPAGWHFQSLYCQVEESAPYALEASH